MKVVLVGSGNLATHLGVALQQSGHQIAQVWSRSITHAQALAERVSAQGTDSWDALDRQADLYLLVISDQAIPAAAEHLYWVSDQQLVVHCSGATNRKILAHFPQHGVLYPVQSFSKEAMISFKQVPLGIEANTPWATERLKAIAQTLSDRIFPCDSEQRLALHIAAVFVNNFSNALYQEANDLLEQHQLSFDLMYPIIRETAKKVQEHRPADVQTGPAVRDDQPTLEKHLKFLSPDPQWQLIYQEISNLIKKRKENNS